MGSHEKSITRAALEIQPASVFPISCADIIQICAAAAINRILFSLRDNWKVLWLLARPPFLAQFCPRFNSLSFPHFPPYLPELPVFSAESAIHFIHSRTRLVLALLSALIHLSYGQGRGARYLYKHDFNGTYQNPRPRKNDPNDSEEKANKLASVNGPNLALNQSVEMSVL